jgi:hypothetical protein
MAVVVEGSGERASKRPERSRGALCPAAGIEFVEMSPSIHRSVGHKEEVVGEATEAAEEEGQEMEE